MSELSFKKQASMHTQFKRRIAYCKAVPEAASIHELKERSKGVSELYQDFRVLQDEIEGLCKEELISDQYEFRSKIEDAYYYCISTLQSEIDKRKLAQQPPVNPNQGQAVNNNTEIKLPRIKLPQFSGDYKDWPSFKDLYVSLIHENVTLKNVQKFHYLKDNVSGEALKLISSLHMTDNNYPEAWKRISDRYEHKRFIVDCHLQTFFSLERMHSEDPVALKNLIDNSTEIIRSLQVLGLPVNQWDTILVHVIASKLDNETHKHWELKLKKDELPTFESLAEFLETRWQSLEMITNSKSHQTYSTKQPNNKVQQSQSKVNSTYSSRSQKATSTNQIMLNCNYCGTQGHTMTNCVEYLSLSYESKNNSIKSKGLCFNCLRPGHSLSSCKSKSSCQQCGKKHHTTIHRVTQNQPTVSNNQQSTVVNQGINAKTVINLSTSKKPVLLATAMVPIIQASGEITTVRALIDQGSEHSIIQEKLAKQLGLLHKAESIPIIGVGETIAQDKTSIVKMQIGSRINPLFKLEVELCTMKTITAALPTIPVEHKDWPHLQGIKLADEHYYRTSPIQMLLGAEVYEEILLDGLIKKIEDSPTATNSILGWLLFGKVNSQDYKPNSINVNCLQLKNQDEILNRTLKAFWEFEEITAIRKLNVKEQQAEDMFQKNISRTNDGRYQVALLFDPEKSSQNLGSSRQAALNCLYGMEKRFKSNPLLKERYHDYINNLIKSQHIELVPADRMNLPTSQTFYLPHHAVLKESSLTTKLRVVFNASRKTNTGISLNDKLLIGPTVQEDLFSILVRWRMHFIVFIADIEKMFRQIKIISEHRDYQRLLWRFSTNGPVLEYRVTTVIDGTASATFLAARTLLQAGEDGSKQYPQASKVVKRDFYMDDVSSGSHSVSSAIKLQADLINMLKESGFLLKKWFSNSKELMESVPMENRHDPEVLVELIDKSIKTLGVYWNQKTDCFEFKVASFEVKKLTKREVLSDIAKLFDPIGWLSPTTVMAKILMQRLWSIEGLDWDHKLPEDEQIQWTNYRQQISAVEQIEIPRWIGTTEIIKIELHGFADASLLAYAAVVYARVILSDKSIKVSLISAKTKVAPLKTISINKLELCGCVILSTLITKIKAAYHSDSIDMHMYTDSSVALASITSHPNHWNTFVANRVTDIQQLSNTKSWHFVDTNNNPADCASRGVLPSDLKNHKLWWNGPSWLSSKENYWQKQQQKFETDLERRKVIRTMHITTFVQDIHMEKALKRHSDLFKLLRITSFVLRWLPRNKKIRDNIPNAHEYSTSLKAWIKFTQKQSFGLEINDCLNGDELATKSKLISLRPFLDADGILRVGGRLRKSDLPYDQKHPIILPKKHHLTKLIIEQAHKLTLHGGPKLMSAYLNKYWILGKAEQIKRVIKNCMACFPHNCKPQHQIMADLPRNRITQHRCFLHTGVDYAGPIYTKNFIGRSRGKYAVTSLKSYIAIFVCFSTKAVHIELVSNQTSVSFIEAYKRFTARCGKISDLYSDCGTNFVGADRILREQLEQTMNDPLVKNYLAKDGTNWHFNPPATPHFNGLAEAGVKSIKYHLKRLCGDNQFTFEEMTTILCQVQACLNSRPLCPMNDDLYDNDYLTPGHFLIGEAPITVPQPNLLETNPNRLSRWQLAQKVYQQFWKHWSRDYLSQLQQRTKWMKLYDNVRVGQLVLYREDNLPPTKWPLARILEIHPGDDNNTRAVTLKTAKTILKRPIERISVLPIDQ